jgi:hypothetical protein
MKTSSVIVTLHITLRQLSEFILRLKILFLLLKNRFKISHKYIINLTVYEYEKMSYVLAPKVDSKVTIHCPLDQDV